MMVIVAGEGAIVSQLSWLGTFAPRPAMPSATFDAAKVEQGLLLDVNGKFPL